MSEAKAYGISVVELLGVVFVALKLMGYITWSWWWVTVPFWGMLALALAVLVVVGVGAVVWGVYKRVARKIRITVKPRSSPTTDLFKRYGSPR